MCILTSIIIDRKKNNDFVKKKGKTTKVGMRTKMINMVNMDSNDKKNELYSLK